MRYFLLVALLFGCAVHPEPVGTESSELLLPRGTSRVLDYVDPSPGFPEGVATRGAVTFVAGPATSGNGGTGPSYVRVLRTFDGKDLGTCNIVGEDLSVDHSAAGLALDGYGRLYVATGQLGVVRMWPRSCALSPTPSAFQEQYSPAVPDVPTCAADPSGPCQIFPVDLPPLVNDMAFDPDGNLYVTDSLQMIIWKVPAGGGSIEIWSADPRLISNFGPNGIRVTPDREHFWVTVTGGPALTDPTIPPAPSFIWKIAIDDPTDMELIGQFGEFDGPDGIAFGVSGKAYVTMAYDNSIAVLDATSGFELDRLRGPTDGGQAWDNPAVLEFATLTPTLTFANHSLTNPNPDNFAVIQVGVRDFGVGRVEPIF